MKNLILTIAALALLSAPVFAEDFTITVAPKHDLLLDYLAAKKGLSKKEVIEQAVNMHLRGLVGQREKAEKQSRCDKYNALPQADKDDLDTKLGSKVC